MKSWGAQGLSMQDLMQNQLSLSTDFSYLGSDRRDHQTHNGTWVPNSYGFQWEFRHLNMCETADLSKSCTWLLEFDNIVIDFSPINTKNKFRPECCTIFGWVFQLVVWIQRWSWVQGKHTVLRFHFGFWSFAFIDFRRDSHLKWRSLNQNHVCVH